MKIKTKLYILSSVVAIMSIAALFTVEYAIEHENELSAIEVNLEDVSLSVMEMRAEEKNFLMTSNIKYVDAFNKKEKEVLEQLEVMENNLEEIGIHEQGEHEIVEAIKSYRTKFDELAQAVKWIGETADKGLKKALRDVAHGLEASFREIGSEALLNDILMLRRHEKDFLIRMDDKYAHKLYSRVDLAIQHLKDTGLTDKETANLTLKLKAYQGAFETIAHTYKNIGYDLNNGIRGHLNKLDKRIAGLSEQLRVRVVKETEVMKEEFSLMVTIGFILGGLLMMIGISILVRSISKSTNEIKNCFAEIQKTYDFSHRCKLEATDEIGEVGEVLNGLLHDLQDAFKETNLVMANIAKGELSRRIIANFHGDLGVLKNNVNASADNIESVMSGIGQSVSELNEGRFDNHIEIECEGVYSDMLLNIKNVMTRLNDIVQATNTVAHKMNEGEFGESINVQAPGLFGEMIGNINNSLNHISTAIHGISEVVERQAQGDLTCKLPDENFKGQLAELKEAINRSIVKMGEVVNASANIASEVNASANEVAQGSSDLSQRVQEQAASLEETSATMEQITSQVSQSADSAKEAATLVHGVQEKTASGQKVMTQTIGAMQSIQGASERIADIVTLIDGIAFQTNLLALNAAVEAARAGDHGRGFAVVAGEVRSLAGKSAEAAKEIKDLIEDSVARIDNGAKLAGQSGDYLNEINESVASVVQMIEQISMASQEQSTGIAQINQAITQIDQVTQQNAALVEETSAASENLTNQATKLNNEMDFFKT
ncbi:MAG: methyl-accepting chemotaxis protein [Thiomicrospira sp.]|nr:methyl-accepting chemotaxis protein [Thiomicrospira sp.]NCN66328.1 methyl-accepting chemotaxis protein [Thiomicrospira sp.]NCO14782.1 methyl-accepting chemotaxis protein [Thiomicrospira sp.]NCO82378.1 methyl-accepting chemotaxis protein [Thiomicrospira sp.]OIP95493.1 MAG: hypothetical protein AUK56_05480 [Thiomicrospira sp. CG2_30_44_34]